MEIFGGQQVWISSEEIAHDLLSKRGAIYSDRPVIPNLPDNRTSGDYLALLGRTGIKNFLHFLSYSDLSLDTWKRQRKYAHQIVSKSAAENMYSYPTIECRRLLYRMSQDPSKYISHIEEYTSRTISQLSWGSPDHATELRVGTFGLLVTISPSGKIPNVVSPLAKIPAWLSPWKQREKARHSREEDFFHEAYNTVKSAVAEGIAKPSYMKMFLEDKANERVASMEDKEGRYVVGMMAIAGALTIGSPLQTYILAMCHYPWWQIRIREEIGRVCGDRCPEWNDREQLPTLRAVMKEIVRWRPPVPTVEAFSSNTVTPLTPNQHRHSSSLRKGRHLQRIFYPCWRYHPVARMVCHVILAYLSSWYIQ
jgi:cytochrome P450